ncbi:MAG: hypothetical protein NTZ78_02405 [Candidatus Aureabacteria bacterium]|nr:hypothetical protein [Candidatus Auribacterota bacterium]
MNMKEHEDLISKVEKAKEQIEQLRKQQSDLEREKAELEELRAKQDEWSRGKREIGDGLLKGIAILDSEDAEINKMISIVRGTRESFSQHLEYLASVKDDRWTPATLKEDLNKALLILQKARRDLGVARGRIPAMEGKEAKVGGVESLPARSGGISSLSTGELVRLGFWLALPGVLMALLIVIIYAVL